MSLLLRATVPLEDFLILKRLPSLVLFSTLLLLAVHCGSSNPPAETPPTTDTFTIGGSVSGLDGTLVLQNNGTDNLSITEDGDFTFDTEIEDGDGYEVTILTEPSGQTCSVTEDSGTATANVTDVEIVCEDKKIIFVTAATHNGDFDSGSGGAAGADAFCMGDANYPGSGTFKALIVEGGLGRTACSTADCSGGSSEHIDWIISANTTYYQDDETTEIGTTRSTYVFHEPLQYRRSCRALGHGALHRLAVDRRHQRRVLRCRGQIPGAHVRRNRAWVRREPRIRAARGPLKQLRRSPLRGLAARRPE